MANDGRKRVVITGMGAVSPVGLDAQSTWEGLLAGRTAAALVTEFDTSELPTQIAAAIQDFDAEKYMNRREARRYGRITHLALAATEEAIADAALDFSQEDSTRIGIEMGSAFGALDIIERESFKMYSEGPRKTNPTIAPAVLISTTPCYLAIRYGIQGPVNSPVAACATGVFSLGEAAHRIQRGDVDVMLAGGSDSYITPVILFSFSKLGAMSTRNDDPATACRPFDLERDGMIIGEGAVTMVLESLEHAQARGARILAEFGGMGFTSDALSYRRSRSRSFWRDTGDEVSAGRGRSCTRRDRLCGSARHGHQTKRSLGDEGDQAGPGRPCLPRACLLDQADDRPCDGRGGHVWRFQHHSGDPHRLGAAHHQLFCARPRMRSGLCAQSGATGGSERGRGQRLRLWRPERRSGHQAICGVDLGTGDPALTAIVFDMPPETATNKPPVQLFITCLLDHLYPDIAEAVVTVLERQGVTVEVPRGQTCCGQPAFNGGFREDARGMAAAFSRCVRRDRGADCLSLRFLRGHGQASLSGTLCG